MKNYSYDINRIENTLSNSGRDTLIEAAILHRNDKNKTSLKETAKKFGIELNLEAHNDKQNF